MNTTTAAHGSVPARGRHHAVEIAAIFVRILGGGLAIALALGALVLLLAAPAHAVEMQATPMHPSEAGQGTLLMRAPDGSTRALPTLDTDVTIRVSGPLARARVVQTFRNPGDTWLEGIYVFPLPDNAAVGRLRMRVGERIIEGEYPRTRGSARHLRTGPRQRSACRTGRTGAPEPVHHQRGQHRPGRRDPRGNRIPADAGLPACR